MRVRATEKEVKRFVKDLKSEKNYSADYQPIALPYGLSLEGVEDASLLWNQISPHVTFLDKEVLDAGAYHGWFCFAAERAGAKKVIGIDREPRFIKYADRLRHIWGYERVEFRHKNLDDLPRMPVYDVVLCCNTIRYLKIPEMVLPFLFTHARTLVIETEVGPFQQIAKTTLNIPMTGHHSVYSAPSERATTPDRYVWVYKRWNVRD